MRALRKAIEWEGGEATLCPAPTKVKMLKKGKISEPKSERSRGSGLRRCIGVKGHLLKGFHFNSSWKFQPLEKLGNYRRRGSEGIISPQGKTSLNWRRKRQAVLLVDLCGAGKCRNHLNSLVRHESGGCEGVPFIRVSVLRIACVLGGWVGREAFSGYSSWRDANKKTH